MFQPAQMTTDTRDAVRVHLLDLSTLGAMVYGTPTPAVGSDVQIACGIGLGTARVAWAEGRRFGVVFARPIAESCLDAILRAQDALVAAASRRIGTLNG
ncbi:hypothetical protein TS85_17360 [Sphingomonas hengshuiensis]|uniref:PilZ domain-containing protein n=1 Tax=Sphingomonas hengshuiensis TaxID=1609977 RepID=A0A7U4LG44_9SPHN|nr:hypothetical protein TS85_17360 [Sphingomonas hengshuiensis]